MGIRLYVYALDMVKFDSFITGTLADLLWYYADQPCVVGPRDILRIFQINPELPGVQGTYNSQPGQGVVFFEGVGERAKPAQLSLQDLKKSHFLSRPIRDYYREEESATLEGFFDPLSLCSSISWVKCLTKRHRRWWIGSFLSFAEEVFGKSSSTFNTLADLFQKILRGYDCGLRISPGKYTLKSFDFPMLPASDPDLEVGIWTDTEVSFIADVLETLKEAGIHYYTDPQGHTGPASRADEFNNWTQERVREFNALITLDFEKPYVVSFIG